MQYTCYKYTGEPRQAGAAGSSMLQHMLHPVLSIDKRTMLQAVLVIHIAYMLVYPYMLLHIYIYIYIYIYMLYIYIYINHIYIQ